MAVSDARFAGQIAAPGEEPLFYDDIGCLAKAVAAGKPVEHAWVADHRTREWVPAARAVFTQVPGLETPMSSHLVAHASEESRKADSAASGGRAMTSAEVFSHAH
jgi:copper chaperone NosL